MVFYLLLKITAGNSHVETASIAGGAVAVLLLFFVTTIFVYLKKHTKKPNEFEVESQSSSIERY
jgi:putative flippase GtrA